ncbi:unnamed protein product [Ambrosiozyma monospora]|uniref:Unnamed protein product n=1 Tax=Ambrosiozyma monospora TaxID=43982 RepID=A0A9W6YTA9_AMBMO|nr:unnamed protein product [Ambrosiozyma monospora]
MAHSARSKSKLKSKSIKVTAKNSDYAKTAEARRQRLAEKARENLLKQKAKDAKDDDDMKMDVEKNVSTSGWRKSRTSTYKKNKASKRKNKTMKF